MLFLIKGAIILNKAVRGEHFDKIKLNRFLRVQKLIMVLSFGLMEKLILLRKRCARIVLRTVNM